MTQLGVGKEVLSYCSKCKHTLAHIIVSMKTDTTIGKVECRTCKATHAYKDPSKVKAKKSVTSKKTSANKKSSISDLWMKAIGDTTQKSKKYSIREKFLIGDLLDHKRFGPGIVERIIDDNKIEVLFRHDIKTLIHNK